MSVSTAGWRKNTLFPPKGKVPTWKEMQKIGNLREHCQRPDIPDHGEAVAIENVNNSENCVQSGVTQSGTGKSEPNTLAPVTVIQMDANSRPKIFVYPQEARAEEIWCEPVRGINTHVHRIHFDLALQYSESRAEVPCQSQSRDYDSSAVMLKCCSLPCLVIYTFSFQLFFRWRPVDVAVVCTQRFPFARHAVVVIGVGIRIDTGMVHILWCPILYPNSFFFCFSFRASLTISNVLSETMTKTQKKKEEKKREKERKAQEKREAEEKKKQQAEGAPSTEQGRDVPMAEAQNITVTIPPAPSTSGRKVFLSEAECQAAMGSRHGLTDMAPTRAAEALVLRREESRVFREVWTGPPPTKLLWTEM